MINYGMPRLLNTHFQLDTDGDVKLSLEEFKVLFENSDRRRKASEELRMVNLKLYIPL